MKIGIENNASMLQNLSARYQVAEAGTGKLASLQNQIESDAAAAKALGTKDVKKLAEIKAIVKGYDFTSITQKELAELSVKLYKSDLIDLETTANLSLGDASFNADGTQITDKKFNALELFSSNLEGQKKWASGTISAEGIYKSNAEVAKTNKAVSTLFSLAYFSTSNSSVIGVSEKA